MARSKSVVLTPAEKKGVVANLKNQIKEATAALKTLAAAEKARAKARTAEDKAHAKDVAVVGKTLAGFQAQLEAVQAG